MADLDTRSLAASSVAILNFSVLAPPLPTGGVFTQGDLQHIAHTFSGALASEADVVPSDRNFTPFSRSNNVDPQRMRNHTPNTSSRGSTA